MSDNGRNDVLSRISGRKVAEAVEVLNQGGIVAFPTETYYGLAVDPFNHAALARLFQLKKRTTSKPILTLVRDGNELPRLASEIPSRFIPLMNAFWPGPLTLVFKAHMDLPALLTGNTGSVGVRVSSHPVARLLTQAVEFPITATSANISGKKAAESAEEIYRQFGTDIDVVLDGGKTIGGAGSTIVGLEDNELKLIRPGVVPFERILERAFRQERRQ